MKSLIVFKTHFFEDFVISEFKKLLDAQNQDRDVILFVDNNKRIIDADNSYIELGLGDVEAKAFLFNNNQIKDLNLPLFSDSPDSSDVTRFTWYNGDYTFYVLRKYFPDYDYYWTKEYDVFCNGQSYTPFFDKYDDNQSDLIVSHYRILDGEAWGWQNMSDWVYNDKQKYASFFPVVRLSSKAIDFLCERRKEHGEIFQKVKQDLSNRWIYCELFVPTELTNNGFICEDIKEHNLRYEPIYNLNRERIFETPDNLLYHPVK